MDNILENSEHNTPGIMNFAFHLPSDNLSKYLGANPNTQNDLLTNAHFDSEVR